MSDATNWWTSGRESTIQQRGDLNERAIDFVGGGGRMDFFASLPVAQTGNINLIAEFLSGDKTR
jgi:hypothetical protein